MEIKRTISRIFYQIEPKPEGGFIAHCSDTTAPPLEAATREELEQKIQEKVAAEITSQIPGLNLSLEKAGTKFFSIETKSEAAFSPQAGDSVQSIDGSTKNAIEGWLAKNAAMLVEKQLPPEVAEQLKSQALEGKVNFVVTTSTKLGDVRTNVITYNGKLPFGLGNKLATAFGASTPSTPVSPSFSNTSSTASSLNSTGPITPVSSGGTFLRFLVVALVVIGLLLLFIHIK